jgi:hypothetical protein
MAAGTFIGTGNADVPGTFPLAQPLTGEHAHPMPDIGIASPGQVAA